MGGTSIDRTILEALSDPSCICYAMPLIMVLKTLQQLVVKSEQGVIEIEQLTRVTRRITVSDDGGGIDLIQFVSRLSIWGLMLIQSPPPRMRNF